MEIISLESKQDANICFLQAPLVGKWSDAYGRQPFLLVTFICSSFPVLVLFFNFNYGLSMYFYFPAQVTLCPTQYQLHSVTPLSKAVPSPSCIESQLELLISA